MSRRSVGPAALFSMHLPTDLPPLAHFALRVAQHSFARRGWGMIVPNLKGACAQMKEGAKKITWVRGHRLLVLAY